MRVTEKQKEIMRTILSTHKRELDTRALRARTEVDLYLQPSSIHVMCNRLVEANLLQVVRKERTPGEPGRERHVFKVTTLGEEILNGN